MTTAEKLQALRAEMAKRKINAYVIPTDDFHSSEYVGDYFKCREYMSGFTGSAGTLVVTETEAALWTDGRYFIQAADQLDGSTIELMKMGEKGVPSISEYIIGKVITDEKSGLDAKAMQASEESGLGAKAEKAGKGAEGREGITGRAVRIGFDGRTVRRSFAEELLKAAGTGNIRLCPDEDLVDLVWEGRPELSKEPVWEVPEEISGRSRADKLSDVRKEMESGGADMLVISALDEIAWLLNLRGGDVACTPVFLGYMVIDPETAVLFADKEKFPDAVRKALKEDGIKLMGYGSVENYLKKHTQGRTVWADGNTVNYRLMNCMKKAGKIIDKKDPIVLMKAVKNEAERAGMAAAHIQDGIAMAKFLYWFKRHAGREKMSELSLTEKLHEFRAEREGFLDESFDTIMGYGPHGAIVHYSATEETNAEVFARGLLLIDSGGHYKTGTTDITRTVVCGELTEEEKKGFTLVLKGHLALGNARFKYGCGGEALDILARKPLWDNDMDYNHGTGHGVGHILSVHEGPQRIHWDAARNGKVALEDGMIVSDEPGLYIEGKFGVRHENLVLCETAEENEFGRFMHFKPLTMVPIDKAGLYMPYMTGEDIDMLNAYHAKVWEAISPYLEGEEKEWFKEATDPMQP